MLNVKIICLISKVVWTHFSMQILKETCEMGLTIKPREIKAASAKFSLLHLL